MADPRTKVIICGACGRMGQTLLRLAAADPMIEIAGATEQADVGEAVEWKLTCGPGAVPLAPSLDDLDPPAGAVVVDFTSPAATRANLERIGDLGLGAVVGTTGLTPDDHRLMAAAGVRAPIVWAANMSAGVNLLLDMVRCLAAAVPDYDIEIVETHHRNKKDSPSGTALALGEAAAAGRGRSLRDVACWGREGMVGERPGGQIGIHAVRGGDVVGDHRVILAGPGEIIEVAHRAQSRETFAAGALRAARFVHGRSPGLYSMREVLGL